MEMLREMFTLEYDWGGLNEGVLMVFYVTEIYCPSLRENFHIYKQDLHC